MKFLDKLSKLAGNVVNNIEDSASTISKTYQEKGFKGLVDKTNEGLEVLTQNSKNYVNKISESNKKILKNNKPNSFEDKLAAATSIVVNTTQTIVEDVVKATKTTVDIVNENQDTISTKKDSTNNSQKEKTDINSVINNIMKDFEPKIEQYNTIKKHYESQDTNGKKTEHTYVQDTLMDSEIFSLKCTPLNIVIEYLGGVPDKRMPGKWKLENYSIMIKDLKWNNFTTGLLVTDEKDEGAIAFLKASLNDFTTIQHSDINLDKKNTEIALLWLKSIHEDPSYNEKVSAWIKEQKDFSEVRSKVKVTTAQKEDLMEALAKNPVKRVRKSTIKPVENIIEEEVASLKKTTRRKVK